MKTVKGTTERKGERKMTIRYDELKANDVILFHGANLRIKNITETPAPANKWYPNEKTISFKTEPADEKATEILGSFYANGEYGGVGCLTVELVSR